MNLQNTNVSVLTVGDEVKEERNFSMEAMDVHGNMYQCDQTANGIFEAIEKAKDHLLKTYDLKSRWIQQIWVVE